jgi:hypothetical protein
MSPPTTGGKGRTRHRFYAEIATDTTRNSECKDI